MKRLFSNKLLLWLLLCVVLFGTFLGAGSVMTSFRHSDVALTYANSGPLAVEGTQGVLPQPSPETLSKRIVEYHISVDLDPAKKLLTGEQSVTWTNPGTKPVNELYFHMYPNAFESKKSTFISESGGKLRGDEMKKDSFGSMQLLSATTITGEELSTSFQFVQPDDGNKNDHTLIKIRLPQQVEPNAAVTLRMKFTVTLPYAFARMGYVGDFVMAGQWFPKLAVYEPAGTRGRADEGWNLHQYHGNSEFYADFGIYNVKIAVPPDYIVAATGFPTKTAETSNGKKIYRFYADDVIDFAWAASPHFQYVEEPFSAPNIPGVLIKLYLDPKHANLKDRYLVAAKKALSRYSEWYGAYPYSTLSIVIPPAGGNGAGGMEYPTLITGWAADNVSPDRDLERVIIHEIGHQYWYGMVATNEFEEAWLDEGFTSFSEDKVMESDYGMDSNLAVESSYITSPAPLKQFAWLYQDHGQYADNVYVRAKLVLKNMESKVGKKKMGTIMRTYFQRWKFRHPTTADFEKVVEDVTHASWSSYFNQYVYGGLMMDYSVGSIHTKKSETGYENTILIRKNGGTSDVVPVLIHFSDGASVIKNGDGRLPQLQFSITHSAPADWVMIDPRHTLILENKHINNFYLTQVEPSSKVRWNLGVVKMVEALLGWVAW